MFFTALVGMLAYLAIGSNINSNVLLDLPFENKIYVFVLFIFCVNLVFTFPLNLMPCLNILEEAIIPKENEYNALP